MNEIPLNEMKGIKLQNLVHILRTIRDHEKCEQTKGKYSLEQQPILNTIIEKTNIHRNEVIKHIKFTEKYGFIDRWTRDTKKYIGGKLSLHEITEKGEAFLNLMTDSKLQSERISIVKLLKYEPSEKP